MKSQNIPVVNLFQTLTHDGVSDGGRDVAKAITNIYQTQCKNVEVLRCQVAYENGEI